MCRRARFCPVFVVTMSTARAKLRRGTIESLESRRLLSIGSFTSDQDIGSSTPAGSATYDSPSGTYTVVGGGADIGGISDQFNFASRALPGDGSIVADVTSLANTDPSAKAGVMFRNGTSATAAFAGIFVTPANGITFVTRTADGGTAGQSISPVFHAPLFLKLSRAGSAISAYRSTDDITWVQVGTTQTISLGSGTLEGLAVTSHNTSAATTSAFTNVSLLPAGWIDNDIGARPAGLCRVRSFEQRLHARRRRIGYRRNVRPVQLHKPQPDRRRIGDRAGRCDRKCGPRRQGRRDDSQ